MKKTYLAHYGIKGQRWGVRRFQNNDGSLTAKGRRRYNVNEDGTVRQKTSYTVRKNVFGTLKTLSGTSRIVNSVRKIQKAKRNEIDFSSKGGKKFLAGQIGSMIISSIVIGSGVKNFVQANSNKTFNSTGMGDSPETFYGKPKTRKQVLAQEAKSLKNR